MLNLFRLNGYSKKLRLIYIAMAFCRLREGLTDASTASVNPSLGDDDYLPHSLERDRLALVLLRRGAGGPRSSLAASVSTKPPIFSAAPGCMSTLRRL